MKIEEKFYGYDNVLQLGRGRDKDTYRAIYILKEMDRKQFTGRE